METKPICCNCGKAIEGDSIETAEAEMICQECYEEYYTTCAKCGDVILIDDSKWGDDEAYCETCFDEDFITCEDCSATVKKGEAHDINDNNYYVCNDCYYDNYTTCEDCGTELNRDDAYYSDRTGCDYCEDCYPDDGDYTNDDGLYDWHSSTGRDDYSSLYRYRIGFEVEKEDYGVKELIKERGVGNILDDTGWTIESDGSLDSETGFEAISPIYPLKVADMKQILRRDMIDKFINAEYSSHCGGHITISDKERKPEQLIDDIGGYLPILYAIYPERAVWKYCQKAELKEYKEERHGILPLHKTVEKYLTDSEIEKRGYRLYDDYQTATPSLISRGYCEGSGVEFRIFPAVYDESDLLNRVRLLKFMITHKARTVQQAVRFLRDSKQLRTVVIALLGRERLAIEEFERHLLEDTQMIMNQKVRTKTTIRTLKHYIK